MLVVPYARAVNAVKGLFVRLPMQANRFLKMCPGADLFADPCYSFTTKVKLFDASP